MIIDHTHPAYIEKWKVCGQNRFNGAFYYSQEIVKNIIPNVETDRNWITVNIPPNGCDHAIVFIHNNLHPDRYEWLNRYKDLILVCGVPETCEKVANLGKAIYLPLSVDKEYVKQFKQPKEERRGAAFAGRSAKKKKELAVDLSDDIDHLSGIEREELLRKMAHYDTIYAVGRTAIEAKILGCKLKAYDPRYPKVGIWKPLDNLDAAEMLQQMLNEIDG